jgi:hypothetical protein
VFPAAARLPPGRRWREVKNMTALDFISELVLPEQFQAYQDVSVGIEVIWPEDAKAYLERNSDNRKQRESNITYIRRELKECRWKLSDSAICFDETGKLINGQHRLEACVAEGLPIIAFVARNMPENSVLVMDQNVRRNTNDLLLLKFLKFADLESESSRLGSVVNRLGEPSAQSRLSPESILAFTTLHWDALVFALENLGNAKKIARANVTAAVARAYYHVDRQLLTEFCRALNGVRPFQAGDEGASLLRGYLTALRGGGRALDAEVHFKTERAIKAFVERESIANLLRSNKELFPLPSA